MDRLVVGVDVLNSVGATTLPCGRPLISFLHLLRSFFFVGQQVLDDSTKFAVLCSVVEFLYQKSMVHCVVSCRQVDKSSYRYLSFMVAIINMLG